MINLFRKDLELDRKWWHRLAKVLFIFSLLIFVWKHYLLFLEESQYHYKRIANLEDRLTDNVSKVEDLLKYWERFENSNWQSEKDFWSNSEIYCSNKLYEIENINYIIDRTWINNFNRFFYDDGTTSIEDFSKSIKNNHLKCIIKDNAQIDFLNPMEQFNDYWFYEKNMIQYIKDSLFIQNFLLNLFTYLFAIYIFYYWIFMYIIYWRKKV